MQRIREYDLVKVVQLLTIDRRFQGSQGVARRPQVGDVGTVVHEHASNLAAPLIVEMVGSSGETIWLADFDRKELELVTAE